MDNLINFSLLFIATRDTKLLASDITYIWEKYQKMIGFDPIALDDEDTDWWQNVVVKDYKVLSVKSEWYSRWYRTGKLDPKKERVLNYLCFIEANRPTVENILSLFRKYIGPTDLVIKEEYTHLHPNLIDSLNEYKNRFRRELNLEFLV
jgi:hypothetical protein